MAFFYELTRAIITNVTTATESLDMRLLTVANQETCRIVGFSAWARHNTAGGGGLLMKTLATASTGGSSVTPGKKHPSNPAASTTAFSGPSVGATPTIRLSCGFAQTGGTGGVVAIEPGQCVALLPNGGANGNADFSTIASGTAVPGNYTVDISEG